MNTVCITGANRGIGLELTRQLVARSDHVVAACRRVSPALSDLGVEVIPGVDVTSDEGVARLVDGLEGRDVHLLVNNAGVLTDEPLSELDFGRIRRQLEVNSLGPLRVTAALRGNLVRGAKVAIITSRMGSILSLIHI